MTPESFCVYKALRVNILFIILTYCVNILFSDCIRKNIPNCWFVMFKQSFVLQNSIIKKFLIDYVPHFELTTINSNQN